MNLRCHVEHTESGTSGLHGILAGGPINRIGR